MRLRDAIFAAEYEGKGYKVGNWRTEVDSDVASLYHYSTLMLKWYRSHGRAEGPQVIESHIGWGSVSDQNGMNQAFSVLNLPYYFSRKGGAEIIER